MKTRVISISVTALCLIALWACVTTQHNSKVVVEDDRGIVILPTEFSQADQNAMNEILARYDKSLYKIETHVDGQLQKRRGTLRDIYTDKKLADSIAEKSMQKGFTRSAVRVGKYKGMTVGTGTNPQHVAGPSATPVGSGPNAQHSPGPSATPVGSGPNAQHLTNGPAGGGANPQRIAQQKLIDELTPILDKYNK
jgi:hypothetical protein